mmetsp:Transcript_155829/g.298927  ORF Transcript_155829/g.298927 Transcript_155829/m.298927 type:complete len:161 (-) Transcript_155829:93-575(-)
MGCAASCCWRKTWKGVTYDAAGDVESCVFCDIAAGRDFQDWRGLESDDLVAWFRSKAQDAEEHWLVVPRHHVRNINDTQLDADLLEHMVAVGQKLGDVLCFHIPPFNSIDHLHLHAFRGDFRCLKEFKHWPSCWKCWTVSPEWVHTKLESQAVATARKGR